MNWTWLHRLGSPAIFYRLASRLQGPCLVLAGLLLAVGLVWGLFLAPPDYQQGDSFRIPAICCWRSPGPSAWSGASSWPMWPCARPRRSAPG